MSTDAPRFLTPNQIVAYNLAQARLANKETQAQAAERLAPYLGSKWSKAAWSAAERSIDGERVRQFTADDIVAFSRAFGRPIGWFFLPPAVADFPNGEAERVTVPDAPEGEGWNAGELIDLVVSGAGFRKRFVEFFGDTDVEGSRVISRSQAETEKRTLALQEQIARRAVASIRRWQGALSEISKGLEEIATAATPHEKETSS